MVLTIIGIGFKTTITSKDVNIEDVDFTDPEFRYKLRKIFEKEAVIWHAEVVKAVFGENDGTAV